jgi:hypothetical protein
VEIFTVSLTATGAGDEQSDGGDGQCARFGSQSFGINHFDFEFILMWLVSLLDSPALDDKFQIFFLAIAVNVPPKNMAAIAIAPKLSVFAF